MSRETPHTGIVAEFARAGELESALRDLARTGYRRLDTFSPYPLPDDVQDALATDGHAIPIAGFLGGLLGGATALAIQWYANAWDYPLNVGGRPLLSIPAWVPIAFEATVLFASLAIFMALWSHARLPRLWHPIFEVEGFERATVDRFWLAVASDDPLYDRVATAALLRDSGALRVTYMRRGR